MTRGVRYRRACVCDTRDATHGGEQVISQSVIVCALLLAFSVSLPPQAAGDGPPRVADDGRPVELWETYQWGRTDEHATPIPWQQMLGAEQEPPIFDERTAPPDGAASIRMTARDATYRFGRPIPVPGPIGGRLVRFYLWMRGEDVASEVSTWGAPRFKIVFCDADGGSFVTRQRITWTIGTYPWHCYHGEFRIPRDAASMYLVLVADRIGDGTAWFGRFSWEFIDALTGTWDGDALQDPVTGSVALNTRYDFLSWHLSGLKTHRATRYPFRFMKGGLPGQPLDITSLAGLRRYFHEVALYRADGMHRGLPGLAWFHERYAETGLIPPLEDGWLDELYRVVADVQDPETGYWYYLDRSGDCVRRRLSLGLTFHVGGSVFAYRGRELPRPEEIVETTLSQQSSFVARDGERRLAAWGGEAYDFTRHPDRDPVKCRLVTTWDAVGLVRFAWPQLPEATRQRAWYAVRHAVRYALDHNMLPNGLFLQQDTDTQLTSDEFVFGILGDSRFLERHVNADIPAPRVSSERRGETLHLTFASEHPDVVSFRVYAVPPTPEDHAFDYDSIVGIGQVDGVIIYSKDPLLIVQRIMEAYARTWDESMSRLVRRPRVKPVAERVAMLPDDLPVAKRGEPVVIVLEQVRGARLLVTAVSRYNEESPPAAVPTD